MSLTCGVPHKYRLNSVEICDMGSATGVASILWVPILQLTLSLVRYFILNINWLLVFGKLSRTIKKNGDQEKKTRLGVEAGMEWGKRVGPSGLEKKNEGRTLGGWGGVNSSIFHLPSFTCPEVFLWLSL